MGPNRTVPHQTAPDHTTLDHNRPKQTQPDPTIGLMYKGYLLSIPCNKTKTSQKKDWGSFPKADKILSQNTFVSRHYSVKTQHR